MTWSFIPFTCLREQGAESLQTSFSDIKQSERSKSNRIVEKYCLTDNLKECYLDSLFGMTSDHLEKITPRRLNTSSDYKEFEKTYVLAEGSRVKTYHLPEKGLESKVKDRGCGKSSPELLAKYDQSTSSWKTVHCLLEGDLMLSSLTLPKWGILSHGELSALPTSELPIFGKGSGESVKYPTACATGKGGSGAAKKWLKIEEMERVPTPKAVDWKQQGVGAALRRDSFDLPTYARMFPTPMAHDSKQSIPKEIKKDHYFDLVRYTAVYPTPCSQGFSGGSGACQKIRSIKDLTDEEKRSMISGNGGKLNPDWVEWLMGWIPGWTRIN